MKTLEAAVSLPLSPPSAAGSARVKKSVGGVADAATPPAEEDIGVPQGLASLTWECYRQPPSHPFALLQPCKCTQYSALCTGGPGVTPLAVVTWYPRPPIATPLHFAW